MVSWTDDYIDDSGANGCETRVKIPQTWEKRGKWFSIRNKSSEPDAASARMRFHLLASHPKARRKADAW